MIKVGFLSAVRHAQSYLPLFAADPRTQVIGVAEEPEAADWIQQDSRAFATRHELPMLTVDELIEAADLVVVCSEPTRHAALAERALAGGVDVLIDKPVAVSTAEVDRLIAAESTSTGTATVINRLRSTAVRRMRGWIDAGHFGLPRHVDVEWFASGAFFSTSVERPELVTDTSLSGGGELLNFLLYPVDYIRNLTGLEVVEAYAEAATLFQPTHAEAGVEDSAVVSLLLENGVTATVTLGRVASAPGHGPVSSSIRLIGSRAFAAVDDDQPAYSHFDTSGRLSLHPFDGPSSESIVRDFLTSYIGDVDAGRRPEYTLHDARASLAVTEACVSAAHSGRPTTVERRNIEEVRP